MTSGVTRRVSCARVAVPALGRDGMLVVLAGAAGVMDAVAYLGLGVFTTMMTGNTALLAFAIARGELGPILRAGLALAAFGTGAAIGALITGPPRRIHGRLARGRPGARRGDERASDLAVRSRDGNSVRGDPSSRNPRRGDHVHHVHADESERRACRVDALEGRNSRAACPASRRRSRLVRSGSARRRRFRGAIVAAGRLADADLCRRGRRERVSPPWS